MQKKEKKEFYNTFWPRGDMDEGGNLYYKTLEQAIKNRDILIKAHYIAFDDHDPDITFKTRVLLCDESEYNSIKFETDDCVLEDWVSIIKVSGGRYYYKSPNNEWIKQVNKAAKDKNKNENKIK